MRSSTFTNRFYPILLKQFRSQIFKIYFKNVGDKVVRTIDLCRTLGSLAAQAKKWAEAMDYYRKLRETGLPIVGIRYDDLVAEPESNMRRILGHCALPEHTARNSIQAIFPIDSNYFMSTFFVNISFQKSGEGICQQQPYARRLWQATLRSSALGVLGSRAVQIMHTYV